MAPATVVLPVMTQLRIKVSRVPVRRQVTVLAKDRRLLVCTFTFASPSLGGSATARRHDRCASNKTQREM